MDIEALSLLLSLFLIFLCSSNKLNVSFDLNVCYYSGEYVTHLANVHKGSVTSLSLTGRLMITAGEDGDVKGPSLVCLSSTIYVHLL
jgi:hypothetical protein